MIVATVSCDDVGIGTYRFWDARLGLDGSRVSCAYIVVLPRCNEVSARAIA